MTTPLDPGHFRHVMGHVPTCVTVVTAMVDDEPQAMVIGSFVSVSLDPPLAGFFCTSTSYSWGQLREAESYGVNVLSSSQEDISNAFMREPDERFSGIAWKDDNGVPRIADTAAWLRLTPNAIIDAGDHDFVLCNVVDLEAGEEGSEPLVFHSGKYRTLANG